MSALLILYNITVIILILSAGPDWRCQVVTGPVRTHLELVSQDCPPDHQQPPPPPPAAGSGVNSELQKF